MSHDMLNAFLRQQGMPLEPGVTYNTSDGIHIKNNSTRKVYIGIATDVHSVPHKVEHPLYVEQETYAIDEKMGSVENIKIDDKGHLVKNIKDAVCHITMKQALDLIDHPYLMPQFLRDAVEKYYPLTEYEDQINQGLIAAHRSVAQEYDYKDEALEKMAKAFGWEDSMIQVTSWDREQIRKWATQMYEHRWTREHDRALNVVTEIKKGTPHCEVALGIYQTVGQGDSAAKKLAEETAKWTKVFEEQSWTKIEHCKHEWVDTGFTKSWCKICNKDKSNE